MASSPDCATWPPSCRLLNPPAALLGELADLHLRAALIGDDAGFDADRHVVLR